MPSPTTLVVVDMQSSFPSSLYPKVIVNVAEEIKKAKKRESGIVFVEYKNHGQTHGVYRDMLKDYSLFATTRKKQNDGSSEIMKTVRRRGFGDARFRVVGVNSCYCVKGTVEGLLNWAHVRIEVPTMACGCTCGEIGTGARGACWRGYPEDSRLNLMF